MPAFRDLPGVSSISCLHVLRLDGQWRWLVQLTIISLRDAILNTATLCQVGNLGPILVGLRAGTEGAARALSGGISWQRCAVGCCIGRLIALWMLHGDRVGDVRLAF